MKARQWRAQVVAVCLCAWIGSAAAAPAIALHTLDWAPYSWTDAANDRVVGIAVDVVEELMRRANLATSGPDIVPWARGLAMTATVPDTCMLTVGRSAEREANFKWVGPIGRGEWVLLARHADNIVLHSVADARPYLVGTIIDDLSIRLLEKEHVHVAVVASDRVNPQKMERHRIDLWASAYLPAQHIMRELGIRDLEPVLQLTQVDIYMACNKTMGDGEVSRLNHVMAGMIRDGTVKRIYSGYGYEKGAAPAAPK